MASHITRKQPVPWKKRVLVPFWIIRLCVMLFILAVYAWGIKALEDDPVWTLNKAATAVFMLFIVAVILVDILAIVLFLRDALHPTTFLSMNIFQTSFWAGVLIMEVVAAARGGTWAGAGFGALLFVMFLAGLIYATSQYRKMKREQSRGIYAAAHNPAAVPAPGFHPPAYTNAAPYHQQTTSYYSPAQGAQTQGVELQAPPHYAPPQGAAAGYYSEQPVKPATMV